MPMMLPNPSQDGQAPTGLLKLNRSVDGSVKLMPSSSNRLLKINGGSPLAKSIQHSPRPSKKAV